MATTAHSRISKRRFISRIAGRCGLPVRTVSDVYEAMLRELTDVVSSGQAVVLTGFGRFYRQDHKGHKVRFGKSDVEGYSVLKFSASRSINRCLVFDEGADPSRPEEYGMIEDMDEFDYAGNRQLQAAS